MSFISESFMETASSESRYFTPAKGKSNKVRILSQAPIQGYVQWTAEGRPVRWPHDAKKPQANYQDDSKPRKFIACAVWNYEAQTVQVWDVTQRSVIDAIFSIASDKDFGHPNNYDLKITRTGEGLDTQYSVIPISADLTEEVQQYMQEPGVNLEALFEGEDPFA